MKREDGYYWVLYDRKWMIAKRRSGWWWLIGDWTPKTNFLSFSEIGEKIERGKK